MPKKKVLASVKILALQTWRDPVWSKVIATSIIAATVFIAAQIQTVRKVIEATITTVFGLLNLSISIPIWSVVVGILALVSTSALVKRTRSTRRSAHEGAAYFGYTKDNHYEIDWAWKYAATQSKLSQVSIIDLTPRCPKCKAILHLIGYDGRIVECITPQCDWRWRWNDRFERSGSTTNRSKRVSSPDDLLERVKNEIDRKIHNGELRNQN